MADRLTSLRKLFLVICAIAGIGMAVGTAVAVYSALNVIDLANRTGAVAGYELVSKTRAIGSIERAMTLGDQLLSAPDAAVRQEARVALQALAYHPSFDSLGADGPLVNDTFGIAARLADLLDAGDRRAAITLWASHRTRLSAISDKAAGDMVQSASVAADNIAGSGRAVLVVTLLVSGLGLGVLCVVLFLVRQRILLPLLKVSDYLSALRNRPPEAENPPTPLRADNAEIAEVMDAARSLVEARDALSLSEETYRRIFEDVPCGLFRTTLSGQFLSANPALARMLGYASPDDLMTRVTNIGNQLYVTPSERSVVLANALAGAELETELKFRRADGGIIWVSQALKVIRDQKGEVVAIDGVLTDITERKRAEAEVKYRANYDPLTRLPNRDLGTERLRRALNRARRHKEMGALLFVDLDLFKNVNDSLGHDVGDAVLCEVASRLRTCIRESDTAARIGGDEFMIVLEDMDSPDDAARVSGKILQALAQPFRLSGQEAHLGASVGITTFPDDALDPAELMKGADMAMYRAKAAGRNQFQFYDASMTEHVMARRALEADLRKAVAEGQLELHYQPVYDLVDRRVRSAEALLRWQHPERGLIPPGDFVDIAEETGLIRDIGLWVLSEGARQLSAWQKSGLLESLSVNVSFRQVPRGLEPDQISQVLADNDLAAESLILEITETVVMQKDDETRNWMAEIEAIGLRLSIDDFGTQHSSVSHLRDLNAAIVKIDRSFVSDLLNSPRDAALVEAIIAMAQALNMRVCAEGVERAAQMIRLESLGCHTIQGFGLSRPLPARDFEAFVRAGQFDIIAEAAA